VRERLRDQDRLVVHAGRDEMRGAGLGRVDSALDVGWSGGRGSSARRPAVVLATRPDAPGRSRASARAHQHRCHSSRHRDRAVEGAVVAKRPAWSNVTSYVPDPGSSVFERNVRRPRHVVRVAPCSFSSPSRPRPRGRTPAGRSRPRLHVGRTLRGSRRGGRRGVRGRGLCDPRPTPRSACRWSSHAISTPAGGPVRRRTIARVWVDPGCGPLPDRRSGVCETRATLEGEPPPWPPGLPQGSAHCRVSSDTSLSSTTMR